MSFVSRASVYRLALLSDLFNVEACRRPSVLAEAAYVWFRSSMCIHADRTEVSDR